MTDIFRPLINHTSSGQAAVKKNLPTGKFFLTALPLLIKLQTMRTQANSRTGTKTRPQDPQRKQSIKSEKRRTEIIRAARRIFSEHPYPAASVRMIAEAAHIDHPLIIYYFADKQVLFETVLEDLLQDYRQAMPDWFAGIQALEIPDAIGRYLQKALDYHRHHPEIMKIVILNMAQSIQEKENIPGYAHIRNAMDMGANAFIDYSRFRLQGTQLAHFMRIFSVLIINLMGARDYYAALQGLDPSSDAYFEWSREVIMFAALPVLKTFALKQEMKS